MWRVKRATETAEEPAASVQWRLCLIQLPLMVSANEHVVSQTCWGWNRLRTTGHMAAWTTCWRSRSSIPACQRKWHHRRLRPAPTAPWSTTSAAAATMRSELQRLHHRMRPRRQTAALVFISEMQKHVWSCVFFCFRTKWRRTSRPSAHHRMESTPTVGVSFTLV